MKRTLLAILLTTMMPTTWPGFADAASSDKGPEAPGKANTDIDGRMAELLSEIRLLNACTAQANEDGLSVRLDLPAQALVLEIGGVPVRTCAVRRVFLGPGARKLCAQPALLESLAVPFRLLEKRGTISEDPPSLDLNNLREIAEAAQRGSAEPLPRYVSFSLCYDRGLRIHVFGLSEERSKRITHPAFWREAWLRVGAWLHPEQHWIIVELDLGDAMVLFRAAPRQSGLALRL